MLEGTKKAPVHLGASALIGRFVITVQFEEYKRGQFQSLIGRFVMRH